MLTNKEASVPRELLPGKAMSRVPKSPRLCTSEAAGDSFSLSSCRSLTVRTESRGKAASSPAYRSELTGYAVVGGLGPSSLN